MAYKCVREGNNKLHSFLNLAVTNVLEETTNLERAEERSGREKDREGMKTVSTVGSSVGV